VGKSDVISTAGSVLPHSAAPSIRLLRPSIRRSVLRYGPSLQAAPYSGPTQDERLLRVRSLLGPTQDVPSGGRSWNDVPPREWVGPANVLVNGQLDASDYSD
jgi:hypothetical protein